MMKRYFLLIVLVIGVAGSLVVETLADDPLQVLATTSIIADVAQNVGGDRVEVTALIPIDSDPHSFFPTPRDVVRIIEADVVLVNGMNLEENLLDVVTVNASVDPVVVSSGVPVLSIEYPDELGGEDDLPYIGVLGEDLTCEPGAENHDDGEHQHGPCDPHVWMDPENVMVWARNIAAAYASVDPDHAAEYNANAEAYIAELEALDQEIAVLVESIPEENRVLVTNHTFLSYFAVAYGFEFAGSILPGSGAAAEVYPRALVELIELVEERGIPAIFGEVSVNSDLAETVAAEAGHDVQVVVLYTGSLSDADGPASTYIDYLRHNTTLIVTALGGALTEP